LSNLKDDIDLPLVKTIAYLNLLGIKTLWSCCGYNYPEQPAHKAHQIGQINISMEFSDKAASVGIYILQLNYEWALKCQLVNPAPLRAYIIYSDIKRFHPNWDENSVHYHEHPSQMINGLEKRLYKLKDQFMDEVVLTDTNHASKQANPYWAYPGSDPWVIRKNDFIC
jgi:hypothetical protein